MHVSFKIVLKVNVFPCKACLCNSNMNREDRVKKAEITFMSPKPNKPRLFSQVLEIS